LTVGAVKFRCRLQHFEVRRTHINEYLLTLDPLLQERDGVKHKNLIHVLAENEIL